MAVFEINSTVVKLPSVLSVTILDIDDGETSVRTADGTLSRSRVATKRQLQAEWGMLSQEEMSDILMASEDVFFDVTYPDPREGIVTKTFYVGNRTSPVLIVLQDESIFWESLKFTLIER